MIDCLNNTDRIHNLNFLSTGNVASWELFFAELRALMAPCLHLYREKIFGDKWTGIFYRPDDPPVIQSTASKP